MLEKTTVLIVDDDTTNLEILQERLEDENFNVISATNGEEALSKLTDSGSQIKLIILDWMMPGLSGIDLLKILKKDERFQDIPVIMQTAKAYSEDMVKGIEAGAVQYLTKPFSKKVLMSLVHSTLAQSGKLDKLSSVFDSHKKFMKGSVARMMKRQEDMRFDIEAYQFFNEFFSKSMSCKRREELAGLLLETLKKFYFDSSGETPEDKLLRCSIRLAEGEEINISDRGIDTSLDKIILQKAIDSKQTIQNGSYTAIPSSSLKTAALIRNTPTDEKEAEKAINVTSVLLERFEERLVHLESEQEILQKNEELSKKNQQIQKVVYSCREELDKVNQTYQQMKGKQMELIERIAAEIIVKVPDLTGAQIEAVKKAASQELIKSMEIYSDEQITDQKFQDTIQKLNDLLAGKTTEELDVSRLGMITQAEVDKLLESLGY